MSVFIFNQSLIYRFGNKGTKRIKTDFSMDAPMSSDIVIITGNSHPELANLVAR